MLNKNGSPKANKTKIKSEFQKIKLQKQVFKKLQQEKDIVELKEKYTKKSPNPFFLKIRHYFYGLRKEYVRVAWLKKVEVIRDFYQVIGFTLFFLSIFVVIDVLMNIFRWTGLM